MRKTLLAAFLAAAVAAPLAAQDAPAPAVPPAAGQVGNTPEDRARGVVIFRTFNIAINSDQVQPRVKNALVSCLYNNPMRNISVATGGVFARNKSLDATKPEQVYSVAAQLCGVRPATANSGAANAPGQATAPATPAQPAGR